MAFEQLEPQYQFFHNYATGTVSVKKYLGKRDVKLIITDHSQMHYDKTIDKWVGPVTRTESVIGKTELWSEQVTTRVKKGSQFHQ